MAEAFDAYHQLLGIPRSEQPPHHYRLLGIALFESDTQVIANAAERQMRYLRSIATGDYQDASQRLLNDLARAKLCLVDPQSRARYDAELRIKLPAPAIEVREATAPPTPKEERLPRTTGVVEWRVGAEPPCEVAIVTSTVSAEHCLIREKAGVYWIEDLASRNGTYVNGERVERARRLQLSDRITLGKRLRLPWPPLQARHRSLTLRLGRNKTNDIVLNHATVSAFHARLILSNRMIALEDLGSSNGTQLNDRSTHVRQCTLTADDVIFLGVYRLPIRFLLPNSS